MKIKKTHDELSFSGVYAASLTPMHDDLSINYVAFADHFNDLIARGCNGILLFGSTGEGPSFSVEDRQKAVEALIKMGIDQSKTILCIACTSIEEVVKLTNTALDNKLSAVMIIPPFYYRNVAEDGVIDFYRSVIKRVGRSDLKIFLYHIPQISGVPITFKIIKKLVEEFPSTVIGLKESEGNIALTKEVLSHFPNFRVFVGDELQIPEAVKLGAAGGVSGVANAFPELISSLYAHAKDPQKSHLLVEAKRIIGAIRTFPLFPAIKCIVESQKGTKWHTVRPPLLPLSVDQKKTLIQKIS